MSTISQKAEKKIIPAALCNADYKEEGRSMRFTGILDLGDYGGGYKKCPRSIDLESKIAISFPCWDSLFRGKFGGSVFYFCNECHSLL